MGWGFFLCFSILIFRGCPSEGQVEMVCSYGSQEEIEIWLVRPTGASRKSFFAFRVFSFFPLLLSDTGRVSRHWVGEPQLKGRKNRPHWDGNGFLFVFLYREEMRGRRENQLRSGLYGSPMALNNHSCRVGCLCSPVVESATPRRRLVTVVNIIDLTARST